MRFASSKIPIVRTLKHKPDPTRFVVGEVHQAAETSTSLMHVTPAPHEIPPLNAHPAVPTVAPPVVSSDTGILYSRAAPTVSALQQSSTQQQTQQLHAQQLEQNAISQQNTTATINSASVTSNGASVASSGMVGGADGKHAKGMVVRKHKGSKKEETGQQDVPKNPEEQLKKLLSSIRQPGGVSDEKGPAAKDINAKSKLDPDRSITKKQTLGRVSTRTPEEIKAMLVGYEEISLLQAHTLSYGDKIRYSRKVEGFRAGGVVTGTFVIPETGELLIYMKPNIHSHRRDSWNAKLSDIKQIWKKTRPDGASHDGSSGGFGGQSIEDMDPEMRSATFGSYRTSHDGSGQMVGYRTSHDGSGQMISSNTFGGGAFDMVAFQAQLMGQVQSLVQSQVQSQVQLQFDAQAQFIKGFSGRITKLEEQAAATEKNIEAIAKAINEMQHMDKKLEAALTPLLGMIRELQATVHGK